RRRECLAGKRGGQGRRRGRRRGAAAAGKPQQHDAGEDKRKEGKRTAAELHFSKAMGTTTRTSTGSPPRVGRSKTHCATAVAAAQPKASELVSRTCGNRARPSRSMMNSICAEAVGS